MKKEINYFKVVIDGDKDTTARLRHAISTEFSSHPLLDDPEPGEQKPKDPCLWSVHQQELSEVQAVERIELEMNVWFLNNQLAYPSGYAKDLISSIIGYIMEYPDSAFRQRFVEKIPKGYTAKSFTIVLKKKLMKKMDYTDLQNYIMDKYGWRTVVKFDDILVFTLKALRKNALPVDVIIPSGKRKIIKRVLFI